MGVHKELGSEGQGKALVSREDRGRKGPLKAGVLSLRALGSLQCILAGQ